MSENVKYCRYDITFIPARGRHIFDKDKILDIQKRQPFVLYRASLTKALLLDTYPELYQLKNFS